jgi:TorA maturation chaperone TorD
MTSPNPDLAKLAASARIFGILLQRELDAATVNSLREAGIAPALEALGLELPDADDQEALDRLAAEYFEFFVAPDPGPPPVQSLVESGTYEGESAAAIRNVAEQLGVLRDEEAARGAAPDHLGSELELWAEVSERAPEQSADFARAFLIWALPWLDARAQSPASFYASLCAAVRDLLRLLAETAPR